MELISNDCHWYAYVNLYTLMFVTDVLKYSKELEFALNANQSTSNINVVLNLYSFKWPKEYKFKLEIFWFSW
jgi:hypothetical protein